GPPPNGTGTPPNTLSCETTVPESQWRAAYRAHIDAVAKAYGYQVGAKSGVKVLKGTTLAGDCVAIWAKALDKAKSTDQTKIQQAWSSLSLPAWQVPSGYSL